MYCEKCGKLNNDSAQYCVSCGNPLNFGESTQPNGANNAEPVSNGGNVYQFNQNANTTSNAPNIKMSLIRKSYRNCDCCACLSVSYTSVLHLGRCTVGGQFVFVFRWKRKYFKLFPVFICIYKRRKYRRWLFNILVNNFDFGNCRNGIESRIHY